MECNVSNQIAGLSIQRDGVLVMSEYNAPIMYVFPTIHLVVIKHALRQINTVMVILFFLIQA
jgi:hypothetical protein